MITNHIQVHVSFKFTLMNRGAPSSPKRLDDQFKSTSDGTLDTAGIMKKRREYDDNVESMSGTLGYKKVNL